MKKETQARSSQPARRSKAKPVAAGSMMTASPLAPPTTAEAKAIADANQRVIARRERLAVTVESKNGALRIGWPHSDDAGANVRLLDAFGTRSHPFVDQSLGRLGAVMRRKGTAAPTETELNAALSAVDGFKAKDEIEAMLAMQMVATHEMALEMLTRAKHAESMPALQECGSLAAKLLRTYTAQVEALARLRRGGEQRVIVQHVNVNDGGQAIVGTVSAPGGGGK